MRLLPSGGSALLVEFDDLDQVLGYYAALRADPPPGVAELVPAARTVLVVAAPGVDLAALGRSLLAVVPAADHRGAGELVEVPVVYDGEDLADVARLLDCDPAEVVRRHTAEEWTVAFCGFAPGFGYLTGRGSWNVPRRSSPRTKVPAGAVALAGEFAGVYPRESPGGWQLIGRTELAVFDLDRTPSALLSPGNRVRFVQAG